ncbi:antitermination protein NusG [bacterium]|nr:antitermination protein NusG [bacterium]
MPLLSAEPSIYPETLFTAPLQPADGSARWWVLYTHARAEKSLARRLFGRRIAFYLPLYKSTWAQNGRGRASYLPLFSGYVFLFGGDDARVAALETNLITTTIPVADQERLFDDLVRVERLAGGPVPVAPERGFSPGEPVAIESGPFRGMTGKVVRQGNQTRFVVEIEFLSQGVSVEFEGWLLRPLAPSPADGAAARDGESHSR